VAGGQGAGRSGGRQLHRAELGFSAEGVREVLQLILLFLTEDWVALLCCAMPLAYSMLAMDFGPLA